MNDSPCLISTPSTEQVWAWLEHLTDPEIPVLTLKELGVLREVEVEVGGGVRVTITPTYSGCPAVAQIKDDIRQLLAQHGLSVEIITQLSPAWSTDGLSAETHRKLREYGIAPPTGAAPVTRSAAAAATATVQVMRRQQTARVRCPRCASDNTTETSYFGSTACKAMYKCLSCLEPFDYFKPH